MSYYTAERLYSLLPAVYRRRDAEAGHPLRALVAILAAEARTVEQDIAAHYDDLFIETCAEWVVPYVGDLLGVKPTASGALRRDEVAGALARRRRKGTAAVLEQLAKDVAGWPARVVEYFQLVATTQFVDHPRPGNHRSPDLRRVDRLERLGGPFDEVTHTADVRRVESRRGRHNLPNVGLWVWRLAALPLHLVEPRAVAPGRYTFSPLGHDAPLFHHPLTESGPAQIAGDVHVPEPIRRRRLHADLESGAGNYLGAGRSVGLYTLENGAWKLLETPVVTSNLEDFSRSIPAGSIAVDPQLGRLSFGGLTPPEPLRVSFYQGFSDTLGGGQYPRGTAGEDEPPPTVVVGDPGDPRLQAVLDEPPVATLADALAEVQAGWAAGEIRVVEIADSRTYADVLPAVVLPPNGRLVIRAADQQRPLIELAGALAVDAGEGSELDLDGLIVAGAALEIDGALDRLTLLHSTLVPGYRLDLDGEPEAPGAPSLVLRSDTTEARIEASVVGALRVAPEAETSLSDSIVDAHGETAYAAPDGGFGGALSVSRVTVAGGVRARVLALAENSLLLGPAVAERRQEGAVRFSWVAEGSRVPRRHRCQPGDGASAAERARLAPRFVSLRYGRPEYGQLDWRGAAEILRGAEDTSEMGAFSRLGQPRREAGLRQRLDENLPAGLATGVFIAN